LISKRFYTCSPDLEFLPEDFYSIDLLVAPRWGLYSNMMAQILSQISSHWIIHYHRRIVFTAAPHLDPTRYDDISDVHEDDQPKLSQSNAQPRGADRLFLHAFSRPHRGESDKLVSRPVVNPLLYLLAMSSAAFVVVGCIVPTFSLNKLGIIGLLMEAGQSFDAAYNEFSVFSMIRTIIDQASVMGNISDYIGLSSLSALIILSVLIVPILQAVVLLIQWFAPLTKRRRFRLMVTLEALQAWQYMEVYLLAVLIASWQLGAISCKFKHRPICASIFIANDFLFLF
jgi:Paraquat-inducible protein A